MPLAHAGTEDHRYRKDEPVELWVNKVCFAHDITFNFNVACFTNNYYPPSLRWDRMQTHKKLTNIMRSRIAPLKLSITQSQAAGGDGTNGRCIPWEST